ncbi:hypothetical protein SKAU_G00032200 [Synaphobranchus kaupii]|uniref:Uncharacterized protein n=1 Tax=Synaphobranchus kaupii TaxID=118154 RepID=A0A9Q1GFX8_SYNKA|nr:hypothetical protein SKAU_G00032200 [Synaphobranchus kaupii]
MWVSDKNAPRDGSSGTRQRIMRGLLYCTGDMAEFRKFMEKKPFLLQFVEWCLRGVARVILANNPISGALILGALLMASPWQALLGLLGLLASTLTALIIGQDSDEVAGGLHGFNGMLVALLIGVFSSAGDWYWWLLLPACLTGATCGLGALLDRWDLPVSVYPFNMAILLYLCCTGTTNPYYPHWPTTPPGALQDTNATLHIPQLLQGVVLGVGQIYACGAVWPSVLILCAAFLFSPVMCAHALLGSGAGTLAGLSVAVRHFSLYSGLSGFNGALGCMSVGGLFFTISWRTHLFSIASAFLSAYADIALSNLLGRVGLPACSWAATLTATLMLLLTAQNLSSYRIPIGRVTTPEQSLRKHSHWMGGTTESTDVLQFVVFTLPLKWSHEKLAFGSELQIASAPPFPNGIAAVEEMGGWSVQGLRRMRVRVLALALCAGWVIGAVLLYRAGPSELHRTFLLSRQVQTYPVLLRPRACLFPRPHTLLLAVKSHVAHHERRAALRDTWARTGQGVCTVFLLGRGEEGAGQEAVVEEGRRHGDVLQWDFRESFFNVTLKELLFWRWFCQEHAGSAPYVLRTDDDVFVDVGGVLALLRLHPVHPASLYHQGPYPPYLGGGGYLVSQETIRLFLGASASVPLFPIDDVYVGMCARVANITTQHHRGFMPLEFSPYLPPCTYAGVLVLHRLEPNHLRQHWSFYKNQGHTCRPAVTIPPSL